MSVEHLIDVLLVHVLKELTLLVGELAGKHLLTLTTESLHVLSFILLKHFIDIDKTFLSLLEFFSLASVLFFKLLHTDCLLAVHVLSVSLEFTISITDALLHIVLHLISIIHILHQLTEHHNFLLSLPILQQLHLFSISLQFEHLKFLLDSLLLVSISNIDILMLFSLFNRHTLKSTSELIQRE